METKKVCVLLVAIVIMGFSVEVADGRHGAYKAMGDESQPIRARRHVDAEKVSWLKECHDNNVSFISQ